MMMMVWTLWVLSSCDTVDDTEAGACVNDGGGSELQREQQPAEIDVTPDLHAPSSSTNGQQLHVAALCCTFKPQKKLKKKAKAQELSIAPQTTFCSLY